MEDNTELLEKYIEEGKLPLKGELFSRKAKIAEKLRLHREESRRITVSRQRKRGGSKVKLMGNSSLSYNRVTWFWERKLQLLGKALFKVTPGKTFTVQTEAGDVSVLGTKFLVVQQGKKMLVNCEEGSVKVATPVGQRTLTAGQSVRCDETKIVPVERKVPTPEAEYPEVLGYEDDPLINVVADIEQIFKLTVIGHEKCEGLTYSGTVLTRDLNATLENVFGSSGIGYQLREKEIILE